MYSGSNEPFRKSSLRRQMGKERDFLRWLRTEEFSAFSKF
jgi:hypothetical protein